MQYPTTASVDEPGRAVKAPRVFHRSTSIVTLSTVRMLCRRRSQRGDGARGGASISRASLTQVIWLRHLSGNPG